MVTTAPSPSFRTSLPVLGIGGLLIAAIVGVAGVRLSGMSIHDPDAPVLMERSLRFADRTDGGIDVVDAHDGRLIETIVGEAGFVRGTLRGLARERRRDGIGSAAPFELISHTAGRLTLVDPTTSRRVDLESFGPTNMGDFLRLFKGSDTHGDVRMPDDRPHPPATRN